MNDSLDSGFSSGDEMKINSAAKEFLLTASKWANFLAIVGFVMLGLMLIMMLFVVGATAGVSGGMTGLLFVYFLLVAALGFFPYYYLFQFARNIKEGFAAGSEEGITKGFENLKAMFKFVGIVTIVVLGLYLLMFLLGGAASMAV